MDAITKKQLLGRLDENGLVYESFSLSRGKKEIIIHEATGHTSRVMAEESIKIDSDESLDPGTKDALITVYVPLIACSAGDVPTSYDEFFWLKNEDIEEWTRKARKMNPQLFILLDEQEKRLKGILKKMESPEVIEGKKKKRSRSRKS